MHVAVICAYKSKLGTLNVDWQQSLVAILLQFKDIITWAVFHAVSLQTSFVFCMAEKHESEAHSVLLDLKNPQIFEKSSIS